MANRNLYQSLLHPDLKVQRNGFDLSHRKLFTAKAGELLPVLCEDMVPGDYFEVDTSTLLRSMPLNTAAFMRCKMIFDFFFVPKSAIWSRWNDFISQRVDKRSSYTNSSSYEPNITVGGIDSAVFSNTVNGNQAVYNGSGARAKLVQLLGYGNYETQEYSSTYKSRSMTALPLFAYNFIFNNFYRNPWRDEPDSNAILSANADYLTCNTYANSLVSTLVAPYLVQMHYRGWYKDLFMGSLPNQQFGGVSSVDTSGEFDLDISTSTGTDVGKWLARSGSFEVGVNVKTDDGGSLYQDSSPNAYGLQHSHTFNFSENDISVPASFNVLELRRAIALQKWKEYNMRAGYRNNNQQKAQFGVGLPQDPRHELDFIDSYEQSVMVDEVIAQSTTGSTESNPNGTLGEIAGKGIGFNNGKKIKYSASQHGYLFCIFSVVPQAEYDASMIDKQLIRSEPFDHFVPAFENVGMQPIKGYELQYGRNNYPDVVLGYAPNYYEYKTRVDKVYGELQYLTGIDGNAQKHYGSLAAWASHREDMVSQLTVQGMLSTRNYYILPTCLDSLFATAADYKTSTDQFIVDMNFDTKAVRPMSVLGLPQI